jgi:hypothetical protein
VQLTLAVFGGYVLESSPNGERAMREVKEFMEKWG